MVAEKSGDFLEVRHGLGKLERWHSSGKGQGWEGHEGTLFGAYHGCGQRLGA
jgi:hypothetical protein